MPDEDETSQPSVPQFPMDRVELSLPSIPQFPTDRIEKGESADQVRDDD